jgi:hypothetical protein
VDVRGWQKRAELAGAVLAIGIATLGPSRTQAGERLAWTGGVNEVDGAGGGGLVPWALVAGLGTADELGGSAFVTGAETPQFAFKAAGLAVGIRDRVELSYARQWFDVGTVVPGVTLGQDVFGVKLKLFGDAVFDQDRWWPQLAAGVLQKQTRDFAGVPAALGAARGSGAEFYLAATKVYLGAVGGHNLLLDVTLRRSDANQYGLLGFGGSRAPAWRPEASAAVWLTDTLLAGAEYRAKRGSLESPVEGSAGDAFLAWEPARNLAIVLAYVDLGPVAFQRAQRGAYLSFSVMR